MPILGLEPMYFVSEEYNHHALTPSAASGCDKQQSFSPNPSVEAELASHAPRKINYL